MNKLTQAEKFRATMIKKHGSLEKWQAFNKAHASKGGKNSSGYEFAHGVLDPAKIGSLGGRSKGKNNKIAH